MATDLLSTITGEIETRMRELRPAIDEYERLLVAAAALDSKRTPATRRKVTAAKPRRAVRGAAREAILAALEHGSHTVGELVAVTAMTAANINGNVRRLLSEGAVAKTQREGKVAYELPSA